MDKGGGETRKNLSLGKSQPLPKEVRPTTQKAMKLTKRLNYASKKRMIVSF